MNLKELGKTFNVEDVEWRIQRTGSQSDGKQWAMVLAYITNRAIMNRLDEVCGIEKWKNQFDKAPDGGVLCGISILIDKEWVTKWDGAENTTIEKVKGGLSGAMKRAAVQWGIGRYLYELPETFIIMHESKKGSDGTEYPNRYYDKESKKTLWWRNPELPKWAKPEESKQSVGGQESSTNDKEEVR